MFGFFSVEHEAKLKSPIIMELVLVFFHYLCKQHPLNIQWIRADLSFKQICHLKKNKVLWSLQCIELLFPSFFRN